MFLYVPQKNGISFLGAGVVSRGLRGKALQYGKDFVFRVRLLVLDEVHLLGEERGAVLEAIVSRTRFISRILNERDKEGSSLMGLDCRKTLLHRSLRE